MGIRPFAFLLRVLCFFGLTFAAWPWVAQPYTRLLAALSAPVVSLLDRPMQLWAAGTTIHFWPSGYAIPAQVPGVPAEWIQANLLLLLPLMLATPAASWGQRGRRAGLGLFLLLLWQVGDVMLSIKYGLATQLDPRAYSPSARYAYAFAANLAMFLDTQVVPFALWAGIHFRQLLGRVGMPRPV